MEKKRLTVALDYDIWNILQLEAKVHERSLSKHINAILREQLSIEDPTIREALLRLEREGRVTYITSKEDLLRGKSHFKIEGHALQGTGSSLQPNNGAGKYVTT